MYLLMIAPLQSIWTSGTGDMRSEPVQLKLCMFRCEIIQRLFGNSGGANGIMSFYSILTIPYLL